MSRAIMKPNLMRGELDLIQAFVGFRMAQQSKGLAAVTLRDYDNWWNRYFHKFMIDYTLAYPLALYTTGIMCIEDLNSDFILPAFRQWLEAKGTLNSYTIGNLLRQYSAFYHFFADMGIIPNRRFHIKRPERPIKILYTDEQLMKLLEPPKDKNNFSEWRTWVITYYILGTGNRRASVNEIKMKDCADLEAHSVVRLTHTKNGKQQLVFVPAEVASVLKQYIKTWRSTATAEDYLFPNQYGEHMPDHSLTTAFRIYCTRRLGKDAPKSLHLLRHQFAATFLKNGGHIEDLRKALGHANFEQVMWYADKYEMPDKDKFEPFTVFHTLTTSQHQKIKKKKG